MINHKPSPDSALGKCALLKPWKFIINFRIFIKGFGHLRRIRKVWKFVANIKYHGEYKSKFLKDFQRISKGLPSFGNRLSKFWIFRANFQGLEIRGRDFQRISKGFPKNLQGLKGVRFFPEWGSATERLQ